MCLAIPGRVLEVSGNDDLSRTARVSFGGMVKEVSLAFVPAAKVDDYVLVHVGVALSIIDEAEAAEVFRTFAALDHAAAADPPIDER